MNISGFSIRKPYQILLVFAVSLCVFYPTLFAEFNRVDDLQMVNSLRNSMGFSLKNLFIPETGNGLYYRPVIFLSYLMDHFLFGLDCFMMHLHNVLIHTVNAVMLYFITIKLLRLESLEYPYAPLVTSLLFLLHPITTESVNWISGRTDLLATTFILASTLMIFCSLLENKRGYLYAAFLLFVFAMLTKETSLAFLPCFIFLATYRISFKKNKKILFVALFMGIAAIGSFFLLRSMAFSSNAKNISTTFLVIFNTPERTLQLVLTAIGFYMKKLFIPMPLNFAIYEVNALYEFVAWPIIALFIYMAWKRSILSIIFLSSFILLTPAFLIVLNQIAWTPFAERYIYTSSAFVSLATVIYLRKYLEFPAEMYRRCFVFLVLIVFAGFTFDRNLIWQSSYRLVSDTVEKSPESTDMKTVLASMLIERGEFIKARSIISTIKSPPGLFYDERGDLLEADILEREGKLEAAIKLLEYVVKNTNNKSAAALGAIIQLSEKCEIKSDLVDKSFFRKKIFLARKKLLRATKDATILYNLGNDAFKLNDKQTANTYFKLATQNIPLKDPKNKQSLKMLKLLAGE